MRWPLFLVMLCLAGCDSASDGPSCEGSEGECYSYVARSEDGRTLVRGILDVLVDDQGLAQGVWQTVRVSQGDPGPQVGAGFLAGRIEGDRFEVVLSPEREDGGVELSGTIRGGSVAGLWTWAATGGPFKATRQSAGR